MILMSSAKCVEKYLVVRVVHGHRTMKGLPIAFNSANICFSFEERYAYGVVENQEQR